MPQSENPPRTGGGGERLRWKPQHPRAQPRLRRRSDETLVIGASSVGTAFEWYDFFLYGTLLPYINRHFFTVEGIDENTGFLLALGAFSAGFVVRPLGALIFGWIGDMVGRKSTFLVAMVIMGLSTFAVGFLPSYNQMEAMGAGLGIIAPIDAGGLARAAGPGGRRPVWRRADLCGRARQAHGPRLVDQLDPDHGDGGPACLAGC